VVAKGKDCFWLLDVDFWAWSGGWGGAWGGGRGVYIGVMGEIGKGW
jgi:hypothetical protein